MNLVNMYTCNHNALFNVGYSISYRRRIFAKCIDIFIISRFFKDSILTVILPCRPRPRGMMGHVVQFEKRELLEKNSPIKLMLNSLVAI